MKTQPTAEQLAALASYAKSYGRQWKANLRQSWMTGNYLAGDNAPALQQIRNTFGPSWLVRFKLPACTECNAQTQEECICDPLNHTVSGGYVVTWEMDIDASTPQQAAQQAFEHMQRPGTSANVFDVADEDGNITRVDLEELRQQTPTPSGSACATCFNSDFDTCRCTPSGSEQSKSWTLTPVICGECEATADTVLELAKHWKASGHKTARVKLNSGPRRRKEDQLGTAHTYFTRAAECIRLCEALAAFWGDGVCDAPIWPGAYLTEEDTPIRDLIRAAVGWRKP